MKKTKKKEHSVRVVQCPWKNPKISGLIPMEVQTGNIAVIATKMANSPSQISLWKR